MKMIKSQILLFQEAERSNLIIIIIIIIQTNPVYFKNKVESKIQSERTIFQFRDRDTNNQIATAAADLQTNNIPNKEEEQILQQASLRSKIKAKKKQNIMGQACITSKQKSSTNAKKVEKEIASISQPQKQTAVPQTNGRGGSDANEQQEVIEFLFDVSNPSFQQNTGVIKHKKTIDHATCNNSGCFITTESIKTVYSISDIVLGKGSFGTVKEANLLANPSKKFAIKCINKDSGGDSNDFDWLYREVSIFRQLDHPNIAKLYECYQDEKHFYLVMENCNGGQLLQKVLEEKRFNENFASQVIGQMFSAVKYLHELGIVHRDLKPENFLFTSDMHEIKMIDFGLSKQYSTLDLMKNKINDMYKQQMGKNSIFSPLSNTSQNSNKMQTIVGTVHYIAPEVLTGTYDNRCDIWSLGVILYCILYGEFPFTGRNDNEIFDQIRRGNFQFKEEIKLSKQAKDLIRQMICVDPKKRIEMASALKHQWFKLQNTHQFDQGRLLQIKHINNIKSYPTKLSPFQRLFIHFYFKIFSNNSFIKEFTRIFRAIDENNEGIINAACLQKSMTHLGYKESMNEITKIVNKISEVCHLRIGESPNTKMEEYIEYTLFLESNIDRTILNSEEIQHQIFSYIDSSNKGYINKEDIENCLKREGLCCSEEYIKHLQSEFASMLTNLTQINHLDDEVLDDSKTKILFIEFQRILNPAPPTQNNSYLMENTVSESGNTKVQTQQTNQQKVQVFI